MAWRMNGTSGKTPEPLLLKMQFDVVSVRLTAHVSEACCNQAKVALDTDLAGYPRAFNPVELLLAAVSALMIKGTERVVPILKLKPRGVEVRVHGVRQEVPPKMESISYEILVDTDEPDRRLDFLHENRRA
jgi:hypothetical protein